MDAEKRPLNPISPAKARILLTQKKAAVFRHQPFTIILKYAVKSSTEDLRLKIDPGSKFTGIALVNDGTGEVVWGADIQHRGMVIKNALESRRSLRRGRRGRKTRYRQPRFLNRTRVKGWLAPSLMSRVENVITWVNRLRKLAPIAAISQELVRFDTQIMENPEVSGVEYQQGELAGYEVREYLLEKFNRQCVYCGAVDTRLEIEHLIPRSKGGSNRVSNLAIACHKCNQKKGAKDIKDFLSKKKELLNKILKRVKAPLKDAAAVNSTRWCLYNRLKETGLLVEVGTGGRTKFNRCRQKFPKAHWIDAACVGASTPENLIIKDVKPLLISAKGHGVRQRVTTDKYGFPKCHKARIKSFMGYKTGDLVKAVIPSGKNKGTHYGRVTIRQRPSFTLDKMDVHPKYLSLLQKADGYAYSSLELLVNDCIGS
jgi:5-methylcytosine-specific restriction endonuclease McrA